MTCPRSPAAVQLSESTVLAELAILEYLLHQSISLRLAYFNPVNPFLDAAERDVALQQAHYYCEIIQTFAKGDLPFDDSLQRRLAWAQFVGLALFFRQDAVCWDGQRSEKDTQLGFLAAIPLFKDLIAGLDIHRNPATVSMALEMAVQFWVMNHTAGQCKVEKASKKAAVSEFARLLDLTLCDASFQQSLSLKYDTLIADRLEKQDLAQKYPYSVLARHLGNYLRNVYQDIEPPIIARFCENNDIRGEVYNATQAVASLTIDTQMGPLFHDSQFHVLTQPPNVLMNTSSHEPSASRGHKVAIERLEPRAATLPFPSSSPSLHLGIGSQPQPSRDASVENCGFPSLTVPACSNLRHSPLPKELHDFCRNFKVLPAHVFRQCVCKDDDVLASIMEGTDKQVKEFLKRSAVRSSMLQDPRNGSPRLKVPQKRSNALLDRHGSAERIDWSSATPSPPRNPAGGATSGIPRSTLTQTLRRQWSEREVHYLIEGYRKFGPNWAHILKMYKFDGRTNVNLKDKVRNLIKNGRL